MCVRNISIMGSVFFWLGGTVCVGQAIGVDSPDLEAKVSQVSNEPAEDLFDDSAYNELPNGQSVDVASFGQISLHVKDLDLTKVLQLLSIQTQRNIIASRNVAGSVSADLYDVDFYQALDAILQSNGFGYEEKGNFIYVYTVSELQAIQDANRKMVNRIVRLNYLTATDASTFMQPLLSTGGTLAVTGDVGAGIQPSIGDVGGDSFAGQHTILIHDFPENVEEIMLQLKELDTRPMQILIEATILTAKVVEGNELGVDFSIFTDMNIGDFTSPLSAVDEIINGTVTGNGAQLIQSTVGNTAKTGNGIKLGFFGSDFSVFIRALDSVTDTTVLARPHLVVLNRQRADILIGQKLGYLSSTSTDTSTTQTVEFLEVGTQLTVRPHATNDGYVRLEIRPSISDGSTTVQAGAVIPFENTSEMISNVMVRSGQTVVMGGFFKESDQHSRKHIPFIGELPIIGALGSGQDDAVSRDEVIFMVKPTILRDEMLAVMGQSALDGAQRAVIGARSALLPWSHSKLTASHLRDAHTYIAEGKNGKALWSVKMALNLDPASIEASRLNEQLTGKTTPFSSDTILEQAVDAMIEAHVQVDDEADTTVQTMDAPSESAEPTTPIVDAAEATTEGDVTDTTAQPDATAVAEAQELQADDIFQADQAWDQTDSATAAANENEFWNDPTQQNATSEQTLPGDWLTNFDSAVPSDQADEKLDIADFVHPDWTNGQTPTAQGDGNQDEQLFSEVETESIDASK